MYDSRQERNRERARKIERELNQLRSQRTHLGFEEPLGEDEFELEEELSDLRNCDEFGIPRY